MTERRVFHDAELERHRQNPRFTGRTRIMDVISIAFVNAIPIYAVLLFLNLVPVGRPGSAPMPWQFLLALAAGPLFLAPFLYLQLMGKAQAEAGFEKSSELAQTALIAALACCEAVAIFGFVIPVMGGPKTAAYGLLAAGFVAVVVGILMIRPKVHNLLLTKLAQESAGK